jgi:hypothetical protein
VNGRCMKNKYWIIFSVICLLGVFGCNRSGSRNTPQKVTLQGQTLFDKIRGGWVGKAYGVTFGGPTEYGFQGKTIEQPLRLNSEALWELPGQDDLFVNMTFLKVLAEKGLNATPSDFAKKFAHSGFMLWHANSQGRQNILGGIPPEKSGHPLYNPHADDIDFQIESDFIGLISPGLPQAAQKMCNRVGHIMNYGDGVYGGYFVTAMYAAAFIKSDTQQIVQAGLDALPKESGYAAIIRDVIMWHKQDPADWKKVWRKIESKYNHDRCPWGVERPFNIQARLNGAYVALGLLYGRGDFEKTVEITTRCGQDSDCNPATAGGILGAMLGFDKLPNRVKLAIIPHINTNFDYTAYSIETASIECLRLAMSNITANGGNVSDNQVQIVTQSFKAEGPLEISFPTLQPVARFDVTDSRIRWIGEWQLFDKGEESMRRSTRPGDAMELTFRGNAVYVQGDSRYDQGILEYVIDNKSMGTRDMYLPDIWERADQATAVWLTGLPDGEHHLRIKVTGNKNPRSEGGMVSLGKAVVYRGKIAGQ